MRWVLLWSVLVVLAAVFLALVGRRLWRQIKALHADVASAKRRMRDASAGQADASAS